MMRFAAAVAFLLCFPWAAAAADEGSRGAYLVRAAGCIACHTDAKGRGPAPAGRPGLQSPL